MAAKVTYYLRSPSNSPSDVQLRYSHSGGKRFVYTFGLKCPLEHWNKRTQRTRASFPASAAANALMDKLAAVVKETHLKFKLEGKPVTNADFKKACDISTGKLSENRPSLVKFAWKICEEKSKRSAYWNTAQQLETFIRRYKKGNDFENVDYNFIRGFEDYLKKQKLADNYAARILKTFRTIMREARKRELTENRLIDDVKFTVNQRTADAVYLTLPEIKTLYEHKFDSERLSNARNLIVAACLTGLRYSDWSKIDLSTNIPLKLQKMIFLEIPTQKTGAVVFIPVLPYTEEILKKHGGKLPIISDQKARDYIKEAAKIAGINEKVSKRQMRGGKMEYETGEKWESLGTHTGRRSFVTNLRSVGCPDTLINAMTGHKNKGMTDKYDKRTFESIAPAIIPFLEKIAKELRTWDGGIKTI